MGNKIFTALFALIFMLVANVAHAIDIEKALFFTCSEPSGYGLFRNCQYHLTGSLAAGNQTAYDNNVAWDDLTIEKPPFSILSGNAAASVDWFNTMGNVFQNFPTVQSAVTTLQSGQTDAYLLSRANHTGTQSASTITGLGAVALSNSYNDLSNKPTRSVSTDSRSLNTCFQVSASQDSFLTYSVDISSALSLTTGQQGTVFLEYSDDSGCTTSTNEVSRFVNGNTGSLTIGLNITQNVTGTLSGFVPSGKYVKLRTQNNVSTPTFTFRSGQKVLF